MTPAYGRKRSTLEPTPADALACVAARGAASAPRSHDLGGGTGALWHHARTTAALVLGWEVHCAASLATMVRVWDELRALTNEPSVLVLRPLPPTLVAGPRDEIPLLLGLSVAAGESMDLAAMFALLDELAGALGTLDARDASFYVHCGAEVPRARAIVGFTRRAEELRHPRGPSVRHVRRGEELARQRRVLAEATRGDYARIDEARTSLGAMLDAAAAASPANSAAGLFLVESDL